jgi:two-component SAPR family response regulator
MAMWSISGRSSCSVALTTTVSQLRKSLEGEDLPYLIYIEKVEYVNHWDDPELDLAPYSRVFAYKNKAYEFEKKVRILIDRFGEFETQ